jgi:3-hydroxyisobutyrate dehydrogenase
LLLAPQLINSSTYFSKPKTKSITMALNLLTRQTRRCLFNVTKPFTIQCMNMSSTPRSVHVSFVGLGNMGLQMALNALRHKPDSEIDIHHFTVHDLHPSNMTRFMKLAEQQDNASTACIAAADLKSVAESHPDFIVTSLPTCEASESVVETILHHSRRDHNTIFIDTSTVSVSTSRKLHDRVVSSSSNSDYIDAPVSGGVKGATDATLTFMVGYSDPHTLPSISPLLRKMGQTIIPCGNPGSGTAVKLCNNAALAAQMVGICEAMNLGTSLGVDPRVLAGVLNVSTARCWSSQVNNPHPAAAADIGSGASRNDYESGFGSALMLKDLNLAMEEAKGAGCVMPVSGLSRDLYERVDKDGFGGKDFGYMLQYLKELKS